MAVPQLKYGMGNSASTTPSSSIGASDTSLPLTSDTNFNAKSGEGMVLIGEGTANKEIAYATGKVGSALTIPLANRGLEGTSAAGHTTSETVKGILTVDMYNDVIDSLKNVVDQDTGAFGALKDSNGNEVLKGGSVASAVNEVTVINAATGDAPIISATGGDTNIDLELVPKGTGVLSVAGTTDYEDNVSDDDDIPNKKWIDDNISVTTDGWITAGETWTYASADDPTFTFTITGDKSTKYYPGMRIKLTQTSEKFFIITKVAVSTDTTITVYGGTDYDLANAAITDPYYSNAKAPAGFPLDPAKWTVTATDSTDRSQSNPVSLTWYNLGSFSVNIPIGSWDVDYTVCLQISEGTSAACIVQTALSTANNSASDTGLKTYDTLNVSTVGNVTTGRRKSLTLASKTTYYLNSMTAASNIDSLANINSSGFPAVIRAVCAYL